MSKATLWLLAGALSLAAPARAYPAGVPQLAVEKTCRSAQEQQGAELHTYEACMKDEAAARQQLAAGLWDKAKASTRETCLGNETVGGLSSYIDLLTCVQLFEGVVIRPADQQQ
ncbi:MAG: hypothetical protein U1E62_14185 [Alsobacter sp.]